MSKSATEVTKHRAMRLAINLAAAILQRAQDHNGCHGDYCLLIVGSPSIPKPTSQEGRRLVDVARRFIDLTGTSHQYNCETLHIDEYGSITIEKKEKEYANRVTIELRSLRENGTTTTP